MDMFDALLVMYIDLPERMNPGVSQKCTDASVLLIFFTQKHHWSVQHVQLKMINSALAILMQNVCALRTSMSFVQMQNVLGK